MIKFVFTYLAITVCCIIQKVTSQNMDVPPIVCPQYFEYLCYGVICIGKVTLPNIQSGRTTIQIQFSQRSPVLRGNFGSIKNLDDADTNIFKIAKHEPLIYRVDFPVPNELPKLTKIAVNGMVICSASPYPEPSTYINLNIENVSEIKYTKIVGNYFSNMPERGTLPFRAVEQPENAYGFNSLSFPLSSTQKVITWSPTRAPPSELLAQPHDQNYFNPFPNGVLPSKPIESVKKTTWSPTRAPPPKSLAQPDDQYYFKALPNGTPPSKSIQPVITRFSNRVEQTPQPSPTEPSTEINSLDICGQEKPALVPFISGGSVLTPGQFPWLTAIYRRTVGSISFICGGSLISKRTVLSAAHCFKLLNLTADNVSVSLGRYDISKSIEASGVTRDIKTLHVNPEYDQKDYQDADVALLVMASPVSFTEFIKPICLWTGSDDIKLIINEVGYVAGWGGDANGNAISPIPNMAPATIVSERECRTSDFLKEFLTSRTICAGQKDGVGPCMGDSGGGLMLKRNGRWVLRGVVSAGRTLSSRCDLTEFAIYCDVNYYGNLSLYEDQETTINKIARGIPISYRVDFPLTNVLPKLTEIAVNGRVICSAAPYAAPSTIISLEHTVTTTVQTISTPLNADIDDGFKMIQRRPIQINPIDEEYPMNIRNPFMRPVRPRPVMTDDDAIFYQQQSNRPAARPVQPVVQVPSVIEQKSQPSSPIQPPTSTNNQVACGQERMEPAIVPYISGGTLLRPGQFPWLTAIYHKTVGGTSFICGGSLISARTVLTAAHCFQLTQLKAESITVSLGRYNLTNSMETSVVSRDIQTLIINPEYDSKNYQDADVALLIMVTPVSFTEFIKPICLWTGSEDVSLVVNETGYVAGWGGDAGGTVISPIPKIAPANIVSEAVCRQSSDLLKAIVTSRTLCAGQQDGVGPCMGDSGGGLMIKRNGSWLLRGVVSAGQTENSRCNLRHFVVYCDVAKYNTWVRSHLME